MLESASRGDVEFQKDLIRSRIDGTKKVDDTSRTPSRRRGRRVLKVEGDPSLKLSKAKHEEETNSDDEDEKLLMEGGKRETLHATEKLESVRGKVSRTKSEMLSHPRRVERSKSEYVASSPRKQQQQHEEEPSTKRGPPTRARSTSFDGAPKDVRRGTRRPSHGEGKQHTSPRNRGEGSEAILQFDPTRSGSVRRSRMGANETIETKSPDGKMVKGRVSAIQHDDDDDESDSNHGYLKGISKVSGHDDNGAEDLSQLSGHEDDDGGTKQGRRRRTARTSSRLRRREVKHDSLGTSLSGLDLGYGQASASSAVEYDEESENENGSVSMCHESFSRRRARRRSGTARQHKTSHHDDPIDALQFEPPSMERHKSAGTEQKGMPCGSHETNQEGEPKARRRASVFTKADLDELHDGYAEKPIINSSAVAEFEKVQAAANALEEEKKGKKKGLKGLGRILKGLGSGKGGDTDNESVGSKSRDRVARGPLRHALLLNDESSVSNDSQPF